MGQDSCLIWEADLESEFINLEERDQEEDQEIQMRQSHHQRHFSRHLWDCYLYCLS